MSKQNQKWKSTLCFYFMPFVEGSKRIIIIINLIFFFFGYLMSSVKWTHFSKIFFNFLILILFVEIDLFWSKSGNALGTSYLSRPAFWSNFEKTYNFQAGPTVVICNSFRNHLTALPSNFDFATSLSCSIYLYISACPCCSNI